MLCTRPLIEFLDTTSHFALRWCGACAGFTCLGPQPLARDEKLHYWVARFLHVDGPHAIALERHGVSKGCLTRVLACARDWLEHVERPLLHSLWRDPFLGALVMARMAFKFEVSGAQLAKALGLYRSARNRGGDSGYGDVGGAGLACQALDGGMWLLFLKPLARHGVSS